MKKTAFIILGLILLQGCRKDFLDTKPRDSYSNSTLWASSSDAGAALSGVYNGWETSDNVVYRDCMTDNAFNQFPWEGYETFASGLATAANPGVNYYNYGTIQRANWFLDNVDKVPASAMDNDTKNRMKGEARFIRAYQYFILYQHYGDVPLAERALTTEEANEVKQTPKDQIVTYVLKELTEIAPHLPISYQDSDIGRITRGAALALKARIELFESKFLDCIATCEQLMAPPFNYGIYPNFEDLFRPQFVDAGDNHETILDIQYVINNNSAWVLTARAPCSQGGWSSIAPTQALVDDFETINGKTIADDPAYDPAQPYKNRDPRLDQGIIRPGLLYMGKYFNPYDGTDKKGSNNASPTGYNFKKYIANMGDYLGTSYGVNITNTGGSFIVIRYAEVLLTYAEAKIEANQIDASVYEAINKVRRRASVNMPEVTAAQYPDQGALRTLVRRERRVELCGEGLRWFDIKRWKISPAVMSAGVWGSPNGTVNAADGTFTRVPDPTKDVLVSKRQFADKNYLLPIPYQQLTINRNLVQNPGY